MNDKILVTYATRTGSTQGVAEAIAKTLIENAHQVDLLPMEDVKDLEALSSRSCGQRHSRPPVAAGSNAISANSPLGANSEACCHFHAVHHPGDEKWREIPPRCHELVSTGPPDHKPGK